MKANQPLKRAVGRTLLAGGIALAGVALASGTAQADPDIPFLPGGGSGASGFLDKCSMCESLLPVVIANMPPEVISSVPPQVLELAGGFMD
jgi:hypothetical protein